MKTNQHYRQGDVLIRYVDSVPKKLKPVLRQAGRLILATGTGGHSHYIDDPKTEMFEGEEGARFLAIKGESMKGSWSILERDALHVLVSHPKLGPIAFARSDLKVGPTKATVNGAFAVLVQDSKPVEHFPIALPRGSAEQLDQSEYSHEEVRRVTD